MRKFFIIILLLVCSAVVKAQHTNLPVKSGATAFYVDGIKVILRPTMKDVVNVRVFFRGGVNNYAQSKAGIEKFALASVVQCGAGKYSSNSFKDTADYYGVDIGSEAQYDFGNIDMDCISKYFGQAWDLLASAIMKPAFDAAQVELVRSKLIATIKNAETEPEYRYHELLVKNAFNGTLYETDPEGSEETLANLTVDDLRAYYKSILNKGQMFIVVAGNISKEELTAKIQATLADIPAKDYTSPVLSEPVWHDDRILAENRQMQLNYVAAIMNAPPVNSDDFITYRLGISILSSALFYDLRTRLHLSYDPGAEVENNMMPYAYMYVSTDDPAKAVREMKIQLSFVRYVSINDETVKRLVNSFITGYYLRQQSTAAITGTLGTAEVFGDWSTAEQLPEKLIGITPKQITAVLNKYITGVRWSYLGDASLETKMEANGDFKTMLTQSNHN